MLNTEIPVRGFKKKTIEKTIKAKIKSWCASLPDEQLKEAIEKDAIITGGAIASMLLGKNPNDYDVYFRTKETAQKVAEYYLQAYMGKETRKISAIEVRDTPDGLGVAIFIKSSGILEGEDADLASYQYFESLPPSAIAKFFDNDKEPEQPKEEKKYRPLMLSSNAITLSNDIQIVLRFCGEPETIHTFYDFAHCTNYYTQETGAVLKPKALECLLTKELKYIGSKFPLCSMFRLKKFMKRGFSITAGDMLKIAWDINQLNLNDPHVLREQLIGMDAAYFHQVLGLLKARGFGTPGFELDRTYLFECVERVFDDSDIPDHEEDENR